MSSQDFEDAGRIADAIEAAGGTIVDADLAEAHDRLGKQIEGEFESPLADD